MEDNEKEVNLGGVESWRHSITILRWPTWIPNMLAFNWKRKMHAVVALSNLLYAIFSWNIYQL